jgi:hypothetical protein
VGVEPGDHLWSRRFLKASFKLKTVTFIMS